MTDFYIAVIDYDSVPSQISTNFETLRSLNPKACIYKVGEALPVEYKYNSFKMRSIEK